MTQSPSYPVGNGRPPENTREGRPRPGPKKCLKRDFEEALGEALNGDKRKLLEAKPTRVIEAFARELALGALDGRASAQRLVLGILDGEEDGAGGVPRAAFALRDTTDNMADGTADKPNDGSEEEREEEEEEEEEETGEEDRFVFDDEGMRQRLGDRYGEFKARVERAVNANDLDSLEDLAADFADANLP